MLTYNWVFENQRIALGILKKPSRYKRAESNLLADEKGPYQRDPGSIHRNYEFIDLLICYIHICFCSCASLLWIIPTLF